MSKKEAEAHAEEVSKKASKKASNLVSVPTCTVCQSPHRTEIESLCVLGRPYTKLAEAFDLDRRSISHHSKEHVNHEDDAVRRIIEDHASQLSVDHEEGVRGALMRRAWLDAAMQKSWEHLIQDNMTIEPRDVIQIIREQQTMEDRTESAAAETLWAQFNAFKLAIQRIVPQEYHKEILQHAQTIFESEDSESLKDPGTFLDQDEEQKENDLGTPLEPEEGGERRTDATSTE